MQETPQQTIADMACRFRFLYLVQKISKRQAIQFSLEELDHCSGLSCLPTL